MPDVSEQEWQWLWVVGTMMSPLAMQTHWLPVQGLEQHSAHVHTQTAFWDITLTAG